MAGVAKRTKMAEMLRMDKRRRMDETVTNQKVQIARY